MNNLSDTVRPSETEMKLQFPKKITQLRAWIYICLIILPITIYFSRIIYAPCDDTYIFLVYARNFIEGRGLTYNGLWVEGYTSPLWVWLLAILGLSHIPLPQLAEILSILSGLAALLSTYVLAREVTNSSYFAFIPVVLLAATGDFAFYMGVGLEQVLFSAELVICIWLGIYYSSPRMWILPIYLAILILTRPEGILFAGIILFLQAIRKNKIRLSIQQGIILSAILLPFLLTRYFVYGDWLPNTFYIKAGVGITNFYQGIMYITSSWLRYGGVLIFLCILLIPLFRKRAKLVLPSLPLLGISMIWLCYIVLIGGDNMVGGRMIVPILPLVYVAMASLISKWEKPPLVFVSTIVCVIFLVCGYLFDTAVLNHATSWRVMFLVRQNIGLYLKSNYPQTTLVALNPAGIIPYYSKMPTIDMLGLNDSTIAHNNKRDPELRYGHQAGDGIYVLSQKPDLILLGGAGDKAPGPYISDREIWNSIDFQQNYSPMAWAGIAWAYERQKSP